MTDLLIKIFVKNHEQTNDEQVRAGHATLASITGILLNILLFCGKLTMGLITASVAIVADAFNNISDAGSSLVTIIGFRLSAKPVDKEHPLGHGRFEYISGFIVDVIILLVGAELMISSIERIVSPTPVQSGSATIIILSVAILIKLWLFFFYRKIGKKINSSALKSASLDSATDCVATTLVLFTAVSSQLGWFQGFPLDGLIGILVACFILFTGFKAAKETIDLLLGSPPDPEFIKEIYAFVEDYPQIVGIHDVMVHDYGPGRKIVSFHAEVPSDCNINTAHEIIDGIERDMFDRFRCIVTIHLDPIAVNDERVNEMKRLAEESAKAIDESFTIHDFRMTQGDTFTNLIFDLVVPADCKTPLDECVKAVANEIKRRNENCFAVIRGEHPYV
ncbi:MAG: cation transporter [Clostridia bacterium]|nr:cation transporter [Clostridia bacterium]